MSQCFPIIRRPAEGAQLPVVVSIPHYGTCALPGIRPQDYADESYVTWPYGYADTFAADLYGNMHELGVWLIATPYSRLFVDLNRRRDGFEVEADEVRSKRGVLRTHTIYDTAIFAAPVTVELAEQRLVRYYDPYHRALRDGLEDLRSRHSRILLIDAHTASPSGLGEHEIVIGTGRGRTAHALLSTACAEVFSRHDFAVHHDVPGYSGGHIVRSFSAMQHGVHAIQIEVNAGLLMATSRRAFFDVVSAGGEPPVNHDNVERLRRCLAEVVPRLVAGLGSDELNIAPVPGSP